MASERPLAPPGTVEVKCPQCGRFLYEADRYGRAVCPNDGWEVIVRSRELRRVDKYPLGG